MHLSFLAEHKVTVPAYSCSGQKRTYKFSLGGEVAGGADPDLYKIYV